MDRSIQTNTQPTLSKSCIHTKNVYSLIDTPSTEESSKKMNKHLENCTLCSNELARFKSKVFEAQVYIPKAIMDKDLRQSFEREVSELFRVMNLNERQVLKQNVKNGFRFIDRMGIEFIKNLASKNMLKFYFLGMVLFFGLKHIL